MAGLDKIQQKAAKSIAATQAFVHAQLTLLSAVVLYYCQLVSIVLINLLQSSYMYIYTDGIVVVALLLSKHLHCVVFMQFHRGICTMVLHYVSSISKQPIATQDTCFILDYQYVEVFE